MSKSLVVPTNIFSVPEIGLFILSLRGHEVDIYNLIKKISIPDLYISICKDFPVPYLHNGYYMIAELYSHSGSHLVSPEKTAIIHCQESLTSIRGVFTNKKLSDIDKDGYFSNVVSFFGYNFCHWTQILRTRRLDGLISIFLKILIIIIMKCMIFSNHRELMKSMCKCVNV